jgi:hypothetical protein
VRETTKTRVAERPAPVLLLAAGLALLAALLIVAVIVPR